MRNVKTSLAKWQEFNTSERRNFVVGRIVRITGDGRLYVDYPGNTMGVLESRSVVEVPARSDDIDTTDIPVLLVFENGNPNLPIIAGIMQMPQTQSGIVKQIAFPRKKPKDILLDGKKVIFEAMEEIELRCGKSSVILTKEGKIVVKGTEIISRAAKSNKIKGATVKIN